ncbi:sensor histidine kinase [Methylophilus aquaticus]|uniref:histidine kinase n=1 Tax=Methylophilus aquaticus TaxID=1971610 RepID=A0ABT9JS04_9PROT|nr:ATP-binding protein [Methylophilus aquaticus]MDP8567249.1 ATP-binding protein [Methylophilus aquaticus]
MALISTVITVGNIVQWEIRQNSPGFTYSTAHSPSKSDAQVPLSSETTPKLPTVNVSAGSNELNYMRLLLTFPLTALVFCIISSLIFAGVLAWSISHPIKLLLEHLKRAADGDLQTRVSPRIGASHDEFSDLGEAFDLMATRLNNMIKSQSNMLHHVSHELRSPLARIQMAVGLVMQNPKKMQDCMQRVELEAIRMEKMIAELLEIFRLESGMQRLRRTEVDMVTLLKSIISDVQFERQDARIQLVLPQTQVILSGHLELLHRAIENVIRNAVKYGPPEGEVTVELQLSVRTGEVVVEVQDQGRGVAQQELLQIFKPFVRGRETTQIEGHGIGLAITKHIVEAHGGFVRAANLNPAGFMLRIHLPVESKLVA